MATLINICGGDRSGTTMLDLMVGNSSDAFSCGEVYAWFRPFKTHHFKLQCSCPDKPCPYWEGLAGLPEDAFHRGVLGQPGVAFVVDSSKDLNWVLDSNRWAARDGIKVVNLVIWKDPVDLEYSYWKRGGKIGSGVTRFKRYYGRLIETGLPFVSVSYEDLVTDPAGKLREICAAVGMEYFPGKENFWEKTHHHLFGSLGTRKQVESGKGGRIKGTTVYPDEFMRRMGEVEAFIENLGIPALVRRLEQAEVSRNPRGSAGQAPGGPYPAWYYAQALYKKFRRHFPVRSAHER